MKKHPPAVRKLLGASKTALRFLLRGTPEEKQHVIDGLTAAIEAVEGADYADDLSSLTLVMTKGTHRAFMEAIEKRNDESDEFLQFMDWIAEGTRLTKQRIYVKLGINYGMMRALKMILLTTTTIHQDKVFKRLAKQIDEEGLSKNPLQILAELSL